LRNVGDSIRALGSLFGVGTENGVEMGYFWEGGEVGENEDYTWNATYEKSSSWVDGVCHAMRLQVSICNYDTDIGEIPK